jgi:hypothetical protein
MSMNLRSEMLKGSTQVRHAPAQADQCQREVAVADGVQGTMRVT